MTDQTLIRHARLYKRYKDVIASLGEANKYYPQYYAISKAADREYTMASARRVINSIRKNPEMEQKIERVIAEELNDNL